MVLGCFPDIGELHERRELQRCQLLITDSRLKDRGMALMRTPKQMPNLVFQQVFTSIVILSLQRLFGAVGSAPSHGVES
jgi:hypothetical protein